jgi:hypothetical protein
MSCAKDQRLERRTGRDVPSRWQALGLCGVEVDHQIQRCAPVDGPRADKPDATAFDEIGRGVGTFEEGHGPGPSPGSIQTPSSATSSAPSAIISSASVDLPVPEVPQISTPAPSSATALAWM